MTKDILIITCNEGTFHGIQNSIDRETMGICCVDSVEEAVWKLQMHSFCLVILDVPFLDGSGIESIVALRRINPVPIFVISEDSAVAKRILALQNGADDFLQKPYDMDECMAKVYALLRRYIDLNYATENNCKMISYDGLLLDTGRRLLYVNGKEISLTPKEYGILELLLKNRRQILTYEQIYEAVWKATYLGDADKEVVFYQVGQLRRKIGKERIESVYGTGYRLKEEFTK